MRRTGVRHNQRTRRLAIELYESGLSINAVAQRVGASFGTIQSWVESRSRSEAQMLLEQQRRPELRGKIMKALDLVAKGSSLRAAGAAVGIDAKTVARHAR